MKASMLRRGVVAIACCAGVGSAQSRNCTVDTKADWYRSQQAYYQSFATETWSNDSLRKALLESAGYRADAAFAPELGFRVSAATSGTSGDTSAMALLRGMAQRRQWPTKALVGSVGVHAAWLIAQRDSALALAAMRRMMEAGPGESSPAEVAVLEDARRVSVGRGQIHGTQFRIEGGVAKPAGRIEDSVHVDMRREGAWLPPIALSACLAARAQGR